MKKSLVLAILGVTASVTASYGQAGNILFDNYYLEYQTTGITYASGPAAGLGAGPEITAYLYYGASTDTLISQLTLVAGSATPFGFGVVSGPAPIGTGAGWFDSGVIQVNGGVPGVFAFAIYATGTYEGQTYTGWSGIYDGPTQASFLAPPPSLPTGLERDSFTVDVVP